MDSGVFKRGKLLDVMSRKEIDTAIDDGRLVVVRHGWLAEPTARPEVVRAVRMGGVVTCASALELHKVWVPPTDRLHVRGSTASARNHPAWCRQYGRPPRVVDAVDDLPTALRHAARCLPPEDFVVVCDSVLNKRFLTPSDLDYVFGGAPNRVRDLLELCDGRAESGTETMVRLRLRRALGRIRIRPQVTIPRVGRVDLVVGDSLIIEVDGYAYHADPTAFEKDRMRDLHARALGYDVVRLTFQQVVYQWNEVGSLLTDILPRRPHRRVA